MKSKSFGLDIGSSTMKAVWLDFEQDRIDLLSCVVLPTPTHGLISESLIDQEEMAQSIKQLLSEGKISSRSAHIALPDNQVFTKVIEMPVLSEKELASAIKWEAEQYIPASLSTMTLDNVILKQMESPTGPKMLVLLVAAPSALIKRYQRVLEMAGISIASVETEVLSVVRAAIPFGQAPTACIVHIGSLSTAFAIVQQGIIIFTYSIPVGALAIDRAIASDFGFSLAQAEEYKKTYGVTDNNLSGKIGKAIGPILQSIVQETKKAFAYYKSKYQSEFPIEQLMLSGGSSAIPGLPKYFTEQCDIETIVVNAFESKKIAQVPLEVSENASELDSAVGLALKDYE